MRSNLSIFWSPKLVEVLISLVLMISWMEPAEFFPDLNFEVLDFFAGAARVSRAARALGMSAASFDIDYHPNPRVFDRNSSAGFVFLHGHMAPFIFSWFVLWIYKCIQNYPLFPNCP